MKSMSRDKLMKLLEKEFPNMWMKYSEEFNGNDDVEAIWTGEGSYLLDEHHGKVPLFDYNAGFTDRQERVYVMGIYKKLRTLLESNGWYSEWYDGGTVFLYQ